MWEITGWTVTTWAKLTGLLLTLVAGAWLLLGIHSLWFWLIVAAAAGAESYLVRQLAREWQWEARYRWWWPS